MACQPTPTATLFGTSLVSTYSVSTVVSTEIIFPPSVDPFVTITTSTCSLVGTSSTSCVPVIITSPVPIPSAVGSTRLVTTVTSVPVVVTVTSPTQTLFTTECGQLPPSPPPPPPPPPQDTPPTPTPTPTTIYNVAPVTLTSTSTSTDPNGNLVLVTVVNVSTPSPVSSSQSSAGPPPAVIGGIVGGVVGLLALAGIVFLIWKKRRSRWDYDGEDDGQYYAGAVKVD